MAEIKVKSLNDIKRIIENRVEAILDTDVKNDVIEVLKAKAQAEVYDVYAPKRYQRRYSFIQDDAYEVDRSEKMKIKITPTVEFNTKYYTQNRGNDLAGLINDGDGWDGHHYDYWDGEKSFGFPRMFLEHTYEETEDGGFKAILATGLEKAGFRVEE